MKSASSRSAKQAVVKQESSSMKSNTDWIRLKAKEKPAVRSEEHPEADIRHIVRGVVSARFAAIAIQGIDLASVRSRYFGVAQGTRARLPNAYSDWRDKARSRFIR